MGIQFYLFVYMLFVVVLSYDGGIESWLQGLYDLQSLECLLVGFCGGGLWILFGGFLAFFSSGWALVFFVSYEGFGIIIDISKRLGIFQFFGVLGAVRIDFWRSFLYVWQEFLILFFFSLSWVWFFIQNIWGCVGCSFFFDQFLNQEMFLQGVCRGLVIVNNLNLSFGKLRLVVVQGRVR